MKKPIIICVDDEPLVLQSLKLQIENNFGTSYVVELAESADEALELVNEIMLEKKELPLIIADHIMPGMQGDELLICIHDLIPATIKIMLTGQADAIAVGNAINKANLYRYIAKPWSVEELVFSIREAMSKYNTVKSLEQKDEKIRQYTEELELLVAERTKQLERKNEVLTGAQAILQKQHTRLNRLIAQNKSLNDALDRSAIVTVTDLEGNLLKVNPIFYEITGYTEEEVLGQNYRMVSSGYHSSDFWAEMWETITQGKTWRGEICNRNKKGDLYWVDTVINSVYDENRKIYQYFSIRSDITARKKAERELKESETKLRSILDSTQDSNLLISPDFKILSFNKVAQQSVQKIHNKEIQLYEDFRQYILPNTEDGFYHDFQQALMGQTIDLEMPIGLGNTRQWFEFHYYPVFDQDNKVIAVSFSTNNINERKKAEEALARSEEKLQSIMNEVQDVIWSVSLPNYDTLFVSPSVEKLYEVSAEDWLNDNQLWYKVIHPEDKNITEKITQLLEKTSESYVEYRIITHSGIVKWISNKSKLIFDQNRQPIRLDGIITDITKTKEEQIRKEAAATKTKWYHAIITQLNAQDIEEFGGIEEVYEFVNRLSAEGLQIGRSSIWLYNSEKNELLCQNMYEFEQKMHNKESMKLMAEHFVNYFKTLADKRIVIAEDAYTNEATSVFAEVYLKPMKIGSMLDVPIIINGEILGIMCNADSKPRNWSKEDISFAQSLVDFIALSIQTLGRKQARKELALAKQTTEDLLRGIRSSINYAKRIQNAIIPTEEELQKHFDCFVFFSPKDIVSGDFYWFLKKRHIKILAVADCTGHGVPGAFMTMVGNNILGRIVTDYSIHEPNEILNKMPVLLGRILRSTENRLQDGMDIAIVTFYYQKNGDIDKIEYAGAKNPMYYVKNSEIIEYKADRVAIYGKENEDFQYAKQEIVMRSEENTEIANEALPHTFYLCSDGFQDQFGGEKAYKFLSKNLKKLLLEINEKPMNEQREILEQTFEAWKGENRQTDDVLVIGLKF